MNIVSMPLECLQGQKDWNITGTPSSEGPNLIELFEAQVTHTPQAVAVVVDDQQVTYQALDIRANQLAHALQHQGIGPDMLVGVCLPCSLDFIIALLATLKVGGAYLPLDPAYPPDRLTIMLEDAQPALLLTHSKFCTHLPISAVTMKCLDLEPAIFNSPLTTSPPRTLFSEQLAYVIYTSGSTGLPKGVCCNHKGVINLLADFERRQSLTVGDRCSLWTSVSFDVSVYEIFSALLYGLSLYLVPENIRSNGAEFAQWLYMHKITSSYIPPFLLADFAFWLQRRADRLSLRRLLVGVEPITELLLASIHKHIPGLQIINGYGPTEATICATLYTVPPQQTHNRNTPIGRPVQDMQVYLLNNQLQPVLPGEIGEIYIGGTGLSRGYLNHPELTAERFIPHPFSNAPGARLYKTGDLARYLPGGDLEFLGRYDQQVKLHGFRIELGEIEGVLQQHPGIQRSVVVLRADAPENPRLVSYVVPNPGCTPDSKDLQQFLQARLPQYMVPTTIMIVQTLPLLPNGKLDRNALLSLTSNCPPENVPFDAPQDPIEERIAEMWRTALHIEQVGRLEDFLKLGGDSLAAMQVRSSLHSAFNVDISFESIMFTFSTVAELAGQIKASRK